MSASGSAAGAPEVGTAGLAGEPASDLHVALCLLTMAPHAMTGTASYVEGLVGEYARRPDGPGMTILASRPLAGWARTCAGERIGVRAVPVLPAARTSIRRALGMASVIAVPGRLVIPPAADLVHYPLTLPFPRTRLPSVISLHDIQHLDHPELFSEAQLRWRRYAYDRAARRATTVMTISEFSRSRIVERLGIDPSRVEVVHFGVDGDRFAPGPHDGDDALLVPLGLPERFLLYPAALWPHKNHEVAIRALPSIADERVSLVLTGPTCGRGAELRAQADRAGVAARVHHAGFVPARALPALYRRAVALIFPSLYEGFGLPAIEAMACGCPVAVADVEPLLEICSGAAEIFDPRDPLDVARKLDRVIGDEQLRETLIASGMRRARSFSWARAADRHTQLYRSTLQRARS